MSTPIKPPGGPTSGPGSIESSATDATSAPGAFQEALSTEGAASSAATAVEQTAAEPTATSEASAPVQALVDDVRAGRLDVDGAIDQLVDRALSTTTGLPSEHRQALEAQLREALGEDPTLLALRRELERVSTS
ncbi:MAG: hypothetical protein AB8I08_11050 [Sandaracinaceae bacterium]